MWHLFGYRPVSTEKLKALHAQHERLNAEIEQLHAVREQLAAELNESRQSAIELALQNAELTRERDTIRAVPVGSRPGLDPEQMVKALQTLPDEDHRWRAIIQLLDEDIAQATDRACDKRVASDPGVITHGAGGLCWLLDFRDKLVERRDRALRFLDKQS